MGRCDPPTIEVGNEQTPIWRVQFHHRAIRSLYPLFCSFRIVRGFSRHRIQLKCWPNTLVMSVCIIYKLQNMHSNFYEGHLSEICYFVSLFEIKMSITDQSLKCSWSYVILGFTRVFNAEHYRNEYLMELVDIAIIFGWKAAWSGTQLIECMILRCVISYCCQRGYGTGKVIMTRYDGRVFWGSGRVSHKRPLSNYIVCKWGLVYKDKRSWRCVFLHTQAVVLSHKLMIIEIISRLKRKNPWNLLSSRWSPVVSWCT